MSRQVVTYIRVSTEEQASHGYSIEGQRQFLLDYALGHDLEIVKCFVESHSAYIHGRPIFHDMVQFLKRNKGITAVLVYKTDRLVRNILDLAELTETLHVEIISGTEGLPSGKTGVFMVTLNTSVARLESEKTRERVSMGMETKAKSGLWPSYAPTGYVNVPSGGIELDPERAPLVRRMFGIYARTNISLVDLSKWAENQGLRTRQGGVLRRAALHTLLQNPLYCGTIRWAGKLYEGKHEPLISRVLFEHVQERMRNGGHPRPTTKLFFPYRGLLTCGYCGCQMTAATAKKKYVYYRCTLSKGPCSQPYVREDRLGERLVSVVEGIHLTTGQVAELLEMMQGRKEERASDRRQRSDELARRQEKIARRREAAYEDKLDGRITEEHWMKMERKWSQEEFALKCEADLIDEIQEPAADDVEATLELLNRAPSLYLRQNEEQRARFLNAVAWNCVIQGEKIVANYKSPFGLVAEGARSANWYARQDSNLRPLAPEANALIH